MYPQLVPPQLADSDCKKAFKFGIVVEMSDHARSAWNHMRLGTISKGDGCALFVYLIRASRCKIEMTMTLHQVS